MAVAHAIGVPRLQLFYGPMWSGKSNALIRAVDMARLSGQTVVVAKPAIDTRHGKILIRARTGLKLDADVVVSTVEELEVEPDTTFALDEAQFLGDLSEFWRRLLDVPGTALIASGLDLDFRRQPFGSVLSLARAAIDDERCSHSIERMAAMCNFPLASGKRCGRPAHYSQRLGVTKERILVGDAESYAPACEVHHSIEPVQVSEWRAR